MYIPREQEYPQRFCEIIQWFHPAPVPGLPKNPAQWVWLFDRVPTAVTMAVFVDFDRHELSVLLGSDQDDCIRYTFNPNRDTVSDTDAFSTLDFWWSLLLESPRANERGIGPALVRSAERILRPAVENRKTVVFRIEDDPNNRKRSYRMTVGDETLIDHVQTFPVKEY